MCLWCELLTEEELKRLNEALADDNSYSAVSFDYDTSDKTEEELSAAKTHGKFSTFSFQNIQVSKFTLSDCNDKAELIYK